jgi:hypothetical protein
MTNGEIYETLVSRYRSYLPNYMATPFNCDFFEIFIRQLIDSMPYYSFIDLLDIDNPNANLDFIGQNFLGIDRSAPSRTINGVVVNELNNDEYRFLIKTKFAFKFIKTPSVYNIQQTLNSVFTDGAYIVETKNYVRYVFEEGVIDNFVLSIILNKNILPKSIGMPIFVYILPTGEKFFNFPIAYKDGNAIYQKFESSNGLVYGSKYQVV